MEDEGFCENLCLQPTCLPSNNDELMIEWVHVALVYCAPMGMIMQLYEHLSRQ